MDTRSPRERLLDAAATAFVDSGYRRANIGEIARSAGLSKKTVYRHVASKSALFAAVVEHRLRSAGFQKMLIARGEESVAITLTRFLTCVCDLAFSVDGVAVYRLVTGEAPQFPELACAYVDALNEMAIDPLAGWMDQQAKAGRLRLTDSRRGAVMLLSMIISAPLRDSAFGISAPLGAVERALLIDEALGLFLRGASR